jgi:hypothetical protein
VLDREAEEVLEQAEEIESVANVKMVRICECGTWNTPQMRKCSGCNEDISDIQPVAVAEESAYTLVSVDGECSFAIVKPLYVIGREGEISEYLLSKPYVSRIHAKLTLVDNELYISNESKTNFTYVNNEKLEGDTPRLLKDGDEIGLGGIKKAGSYQEKAAYFLVRKSLC